MNQQMLQAVNNAMTLFGPNRPNIIVSHGYDQTKWEWRVADKREQQHDGRLHRLAVRVPHGAG